MDIIKKITIFAAVAFFIFYLLGAMSSAQSKPHERKAPYVEYYRNR